MLFDTIKFKIETFIKDKLDEETIFFLEKIGLPETILYQTYSYNENLSSLENDYLILGRVKNMESHTIGINLISKEVFHCWNFKNRSQNYVFLNSTIKSLVACCFSYKIFRDKLVITQYLGDYHEFHESYGKLLSEIIKEIDEKALKEGMWGMRINEMILGDF